MRLVFDILKSVVLVNRHASPRLKADKLSVRVTGGSPYGNAVRVWERQLYKAAVRLFQGDSL